MREQALRLGLTEEETDDYMQHLAFTLIAAGTDTSAATLLMFFMAMLLFPEVQKKAQKELDTVIGDSRLPSLEDYPQLDYVGRMVQEVLRWGPVAPLAVPHASFQDDTYQGYDIPKGTIVIGNVWAMTRDPEVYKNPEVFDPDRFLDPSVPPPPVFGWGRRRCPGLHFAEASIFIAIASIISTFDISPAKDKDGNDMIPPQRMVNAIILHPEAFKLKLTPRSAKHESLIMNPV